MNFKYYIAEGEEAEKVAAEGLRLANESDAQLREVQDSQGPDALLWGSRETMTAFAWKKEGDYKVKPEMKEGFLKPHIEYADDKRFAVYKPDVRTKLGKEIKKQLAACKPFNFSDYVCEHFKVSRWVVGSDSASRTGRSMYRSSCGFQKKQLVFRVSTPEITEGCDGYVTGDKPVEIPACFREIKKSEFIAITEE